MVTLSIIMRNLRNTVCILHELWHFHHYQSVEYRLRTFYLPKVWNNYVTRAKGTHKGSILHNKWLNTVKPWYIARGYKV